MDYDLDIKQKNFVKINDSLNAVKKIVQKGVGVLSNPDLKHDISSALMVDI